MCYCLMLILHTFYVCNVFYAYIVFVSVLVSVDKVDWTELADGDQCSQRGSSKEAVGAAAHGDSSLPSSVRSGKEETQTDLQQVAAVSSGRRGKLNILTDVH